MSKFCCKPFQNHISKITLSIIPRCPEPCIPRSQLEQSVKFIFRIGTESHSCQASTYLFTAVTTNTRAQRFFSSVQTCGLVDVNQPLPWFSRVGREKILSPFLEHSEEHVGLLNRFCNILPQDLTAIHVKITRSTNLSSVCRRKLKLSTYLHTISYNHISFLNTRSQLEIIIRNYSCKSSPFIQRQGNPLCQGA